MRRSEVSQHHLKNLISCAIKFSRYFFFPVRACVLVLIVCLRVFFCNFSSSATQNITKARNVQQLQIGLKRRSQDQKRRHKQSNQGPQATAASRDHFYAVPPRCPSTPSPSRSARRAAPGGRPAHFRAHGGFLLPCEAHGVFLAPLWARQPPLSYPVDSD